MGLKNNKGPCKQKLKDASMFGDRNTGKDPAMTKANSAGKKFDKKGPTTY